MVVEGHCFLKISSDQAAAMSGGKEFQSLMVRGKKENFLLFPNSLWMEFGTRDCAWSLTVDLVVKVRFLN